MIYQWKTLEKEFLSLNLEVYTIDFMPILKDLYQLGDGTRKGATGKTCWYIEMNEQDIIEFNLPTSSYGLKIIKYPVYYDILDEYYRLLQEFSIQKILNKSDMASDIYRIILVKSVHEISVPLDWTEEKLVYPEGSIFYAQIVEHLNHDEVLPGDIFVDQKKTMYGAKVENFIKECYELRICPYDINAENLFWINGKLKVVDVHKWKRSYSMKYVSAPKYVQIELNNTCNAKCAMCNIPNMTRSKGMMEDELFIKILKEANLLGVEYITPFLHGEPFLRKDFIEKLRLINEYAPKAKITIFTNASMLSKDKVYDLSTIKNIDQLVFSFPGGNQKTYEEVTGLNYGFTIRNIKRAFEILNIRNMRISMPVCEGNVASINDFWKLWEGYPCSVYDTYNYLGNVEGTLAKKCYEQCDRAFRSMTILYDGRICLCCMDSDGDIIMGDISVERMDQIWHNENYIKLRTLHGLCRIAYTPCSYCTLDLKTEEYNNAYSIDNF